MLTPHLFERVENNALYHARQVICSEGIIYIKSQRIRPCNRLDLSCDNKENAAPCVIANDRHMQIDISFLRPKSHNRFWSELSPDLVRRIPIVPTRLRIV